MLKRYWVLVTESAMSFLLVHHLSVAIRCTVPNLVAFCYLLAERIPEAVLLKKVENQVHFLEYNSGLAGCGQRYGTVPI